jgi:hypothetical protein
MRIRAKIVNFEEKKQHPSHARAHRGGRRFQLLPTASFMLAEHETNPEIGPETNPEIEPETNPEIEPETNPEIEPETNPEIEPGTHPEIEPDIGSDYCPDSSSEQKDEQNVLISGASIDHLLSATESVPNCIERIPHNQQRNGNGRGFGMD